MDESRRIADLEAVPADGNVRFTVRDGEESVEGILLRFGDDVAAYENYCQHWTDVRLDSGSGAALRNGEIVCEKHGAYFEVGSGYCNFGPCEGSTLSEIEVSVEDGSVYLTDDRYAFEGVGPVEDETLSSGSRIGFTGN